MIAHFYDGEKRRKHQGLLWMRTQQAMVLKATLRDEVRRAL
jgi:hypothetical protein